MADQTLDIVIRMIQQGDLQGAIGQLNKLTSATASAAGEQSTMASGARQLNTELHAAGKAAEEKTAALQRLTVAGAAAAGAIVLAKEAVEAFAEKQQAVVALDAALANQGQLYDGIRAKVQGLADEMERLTGIDDTKWLNALATLSKFDADPDKIEEYADAVKNLAGFMGADIESAAFLFGKAMQGNYEMLGRYGIQVDEAGTKTEKLNQLMEQLAQRGGGQLEARAASLSGGFAGLKNATGNLMEGLGNLISRTHVVEVSLYVLSGVVNGLASIFPTLTEKVGNLQNKFNDAGTSAKDMAAGAVEAQEKIKTAVDATNTALEKQIKEILRLQNLQNKTGDAQTDAKLADVDAREAKGELQPHQAAAERQRIKRESESAKLGNEHIATQKILAAAKAARDGASGQSKQAMDTADKGHTALEDAAAAAGMDPSNLKNLFNRATLDADAAQKKIGANTPGSFLGIPNRSQTEAGARNAADGQRELADANQRLETIKKLAELKGEAASKEAAYQNALKQEKEIYTSTAPAIQTAADALTVLEEKYKALNAQMGADKAKERRVLFDKTAEGFKQLFDVDLKVGPPATPTPGIVPPASGPSRERRLDDAEKRLNNTQRSFERSDPEAEAAARMTGGFASSVESIGESIIALHEETQRRLDAVDQKVASLIGQNGNTLIG